MLIIPSQRWPEAGEQPADPVEKEQGSAILIAMAVCVYGSR